MAKAKPKPETAEQPATEPTSAERVRASSERNAAEAAIQDRATRIDRGLPPR